MRINLVTPFAEKDAVKALGARWDGAKKVWYIVDEADLTPFMRWLPDSVSATQAAPTQVLQAKQVPSQTPGIITKPAKVVASCGCKVLPWDECEHTGR